MLKLIKLTSYLLDKKIEENREWQVNLLVVFLDLKNKKARVRLNDAGHIRTCAIPLRKLFTKIPRYNGFDLGFHSRYGIYVAFGREGALAYDGTVYIIDFYKETNNR